MKGRYTMNKITVKALEELESLGSALTIEGLTDEAIPDFLDWIKKYTPILKEDVYITKGATMNKVLNLTGNNAYPDDLTIVSVRLEDMQNSSAIIMPRFAISARWLDDIINNNLMRERGNSQEGKTYE